MQAPRITTSRVDPIGPSAGAQDPDQRPAWDDRFYVVEAEP